MKRIRGTMATLNALIELYGKETSVYDVITDIENGLVPIV